MSVKKCLCIVMLMFLLATLISCAVEEPQEKSVTVEPCVIVDLTNTVFITEIITRINKRSLISKINSKAHIRSFNGCDLHVFDI